MTSPTSLDHVTRPKPLLLGIAAAIAGFALASPGLSFEEESDGRGNFVFADRGPVTRAPRVAGLAVVVTDVRANGRGMDVEFDVQMTTVRRQILSATYTYTRRRFDRNTYDIPESPTYRNYADIDDSRFVARRTALNPEQPQRLGNLSFVHSSHATGTTVRTLLDLVNTETFLPDTPLPFEGRRYYLVRTITDTSHGRMAVDGALPGIDFGDGETLESASLPLVTVVSTITPTQPATTIPIGLQRRIFRRSGFVHTYDDQTPKSIRAASGCCSLANFPFLRGENPADGPPLVPGTVLNTWYTPWRLDARIERSLISGLFVVNNFEVLSYQTNSIFSPNTPETSTRSITWREQGSVQYLVDQVTATALVVLDQPVALEIPVGSRTALAILSVLLGLCGVLLLRLCD